MTGGTIPVAALRRFVAPPETAAVCELCAAPLPVPRTPGSDHAASPDHAHLMDGIGEPDGPMLRCVCEACRVVFDRDGAGGGRRRTTPRHVLSDPSHRSENFALLAAPVRVAYVTLSGAQRVIAYPGPAGIATADISQDVWQRIAATSALAATLQPHVEGLLLIGEEAWRVGVDRCHAFTARLRDRWQGMDGGPPAAAEISRTTAHLRSVARPLRDGRL